ncbi:MAG: YitT family protein [Lachnospiraceae bacterium]|nr:YitT family protein [Lachnospiraceae bacterium]
MKKRAAATDYVLMVLGAFIMGFAIKNIYDPVKLVTGGVSGIAIIIKDMLGIPLWLTNTLLNVPLFLASYRIKGWKFIKRTFVSTAALSLSLYVLPEMHMMPTDDMLLSALFGGLISGVGTGLVFMANATTGGTDMLAALIQKVMPHYSVPQIMQVLDAAIVVAGAALFGIRPALYALIAIYAVARVSDGILEGLKFSKMVYIISDSSREISDVIMERLDRGVTGIQAEGMYSGDDKKMLCCVVSKKEISQIKEIVREIDLRAFVIVNDAREVLGEGFIEY